MDFFRKLNQRHERLKNWVHEGWRVPLPPWGQKAMGFVYFCIPVVGGYYVMQWAIGKSHKSIGPRGELLRKKEIEGLGDKRILENGEYEIVGGSRGSVRLAVSDAKTQVQNRKNLEAFFKKERKKRKKKENQQEEFS
jgi:hypothetical protein